MPSDGFIDGLARGVTPVRRRSLATDALLMVALCATELAVFLAAGLTRPDMPHAMAQPSLWWKLASLALIAAIGGAVALTSFDPVRSPRRGLRWTAVTVALSLAAGWLIDAASHGWPPLAARIDWRSGVQCLWKMVALSLPCLVAIGVLMRRGAPTDARGSAVSAGLAAAAWGAFVFVFACPVDDPLYIAVWYSAGCGLVTLAARLVLPRLTRW